jgi:hypothetical protein
VHQQAVSEEDSALLQMEFIFLSIRIFQRLPQLQLKYQ